MKDCEGGASGATPAITAHVRPLKPFDAAHGLRLQDGVIGRVGNLKAVLGHRSPKMLRIPRGAPAARGLLFRSAQTGNAGARIPATA